MMPDGTLRRTAPGRLLELLFLLPWLSVVALLLVQALTPHLVARYSLYPLLLGVVVVGLPHGALDHLVPTRLGFAWAQKPLGVSLYLLGYVATAALFFGLWLWQPRLAFVAFLAASVWHWGQGDLRFLELFLGRRRPSRWGALVTLLVRGSFPILIPVVVFPETAERLYAHMVAGLGLGASALELGHAPLRTSLALGMLALSVLYLHNAVRAAPSSRVLAVDLLELALLVLLFTSVEAYLAVGTYFILWHSLRHLARLLVLREQDRRQLARGRWLRPVGSLCLALTPITSAALGLLTGLYLWGAENVSSLEGFVALYLVLISSLTVPHMLVVALMDAKPETVEG